jgi:hypothetical protein
MDDRCQFVASKRSRRQVRADGDFATAPAASGFMKDGEDAGSVRDNSSCPFRLENVFLHSLMKRRPRGVRYGVLSGQEPPDDRLSAVRT